MGKNFRKAFSLIELLVVILILGLLAAFIVPNIIGKSEQAKKDLVCVQMNSIANALKMFKLDNGVYPDTGEGLNALIVNPSPEKYAQYAQSPYIEDLPKDSWHNDFIYTSADSSFELISLGADKKEGGSNENEDILFSRCKK